MGTSLNVCVWGTHTTIMTLQGQRTERPGGYFGETVSPPTPTGIGIPPVKGEPSRKGGTTTDDCDGRPESLPGDGTKRVCVGSGPNV